MIGQQHSARYPPLQDPDRDGGPAGLSGLFDDRGRTQRLRELLDAVVECRRLHPRDAGSRARDSLFNPAGIAELLQSLQGGGQAWQRQGTLLNVWQVAGLGRNEVRTTKVLAWALDCRGSHGLGGLILPHLLRTLSARPGGKTLGLLDTGSGYSVLTEHNVFGDQSDRLDIALTLSNAFVLIEAKIDAAEGSGQLLGYRALAEAKARAFALPHCQVLYLTKRPSPVPDGMVNLTWRDIAGAIRTALRMHPQRDTFGARLVLQFADHCATLR